MIKWNITWQACFGAISAARVDSIDHYISGKLEGGLRDGELDEAVEVLAAQWNAKEQGNSPGIGMLIVTIRNKRKRDRGIDTTEPYEVTQAKRAVQSMPVAGLMRWNTVCEIAADFRGRVIDACMRSGGFVIPYWSKGYGIRCTRVLSREESGPSIQQAITDAAKAMEPVDMPF